MTEEHVQLLRDFGMACLVVLTCALLAGAFLLFSGCVGAAGVNGSLGRGVEGPGKAMPPATPVPTTCRSARLGVWDTSNAPVASVTVEAVDDRERHTVGQVGSDGVGAIELCSAHVPRWFLIRGGEREAMPPCVVFSDEVPWRVVCTTAGGGR